MFNSIQALNIFSNNCQRLFFCKICYIQFESRRKGYFKTTRGYVIYSPRVQPDFIMSHAYEVPEINWLIFHMREVLKLWHYVRRNQKVTKESTIFIFLGKALSGHVISVHQASSEIACTHKCLSNPKCASFNFEIQQSPRSLSTCELNAVSRTSPNNKLNSRNGFAYYEPLTPNERPKQQITAFPPTTSNLRMATTTTQGAQEVSPTQDQAATPASMFPSTQPATTAAPGKWFAKSKGPQSRRPRQLKALGSICLETLAAIFFILFLPEKVSVTSPERCTCDIWRSLLLAGFTLFAYDSNLACLCISRWAENSMDKERKTKVKHSQRKRSSRISVTSADPINELFTGWYEKVARLTLRIRFEIWEKFVATLWAREWK